MIRISLRSILILSSHLCLGLPTDLFLVGVPVIFLKTLLPSSIQATCLAHFNPLNLITLTILGERYKLFEALCNISKQCEVVSLTPNPQAGGPLLVGSPRLLIQYIRR
jgi:hypothetical protein